MRPPMTATKNDGISPPHWKNVLVQQKEVLAENKKFQPSTVTTTATATTTSVSSNTSTTTNINYLPITFQSQQQQLQQQQQQIQSNSPLLLNNDDDDSNEFTKLIDNSCDLNQKLLVNSTIPAIISSKPKSILNNDENPIIDSSSSSSSSSIITTTSSSSPSLSTVVATSEITSGLSTKLNLNNGKYSQQQQQQQHNNSSKLKRISSDVSDRHNQIRPQIVSRNSSSSNLISIRKTNSNNFNNFSNTNSNSKNIINNNNNNNNNCNTALTKTILKSNNSSFTNNLSEVPNNKTKNLILNNTFEQFQQNFKPLSLSTVATTTNSLSNSTTNLTNSTTSSSETFQLSLPSSETEPLLSNIDNTNNSIIVDPKRTICLNKNSASLIFTKKDLPTSIPSDLVTTSTNYCNNSSFDNFKKSSSNQNFQISTTPITTVNTTNNNSSCNKSSSNSSSNNKYVHLRKTLSGANNQLNNKSNCNNSNNQNYHQNNTPETLATATSSSASASILLNNTITCDGGVGVVVDTENLLLQRRRSLQLNYSNICRETIGNIRTNSTTTATNRKQHAYSWYAPVYSALEEEIEQDSRDSSPIHNLASTKSNNDLENETVSLLEKNQINVQPQLHQPRNRRTGNPPSTIGNGIIGGQIHNTNSGSNQNDIEGPQVPPQLLGGPLPRRKRIENFFKSLVGRKPSKEPLTTTSTTTTTTATNATSTIVTAPSNVTTNNTATKPNSNAKNVINQNPPILQSPEITITRTPSEQNLQREIGGSTTSLNAVQQKLWNVVPLLKREGQGSTASLHNNNHHQQDHKVDSIVHYSSGMRKCETVLALSRQSSANSGASIGVSGGGGGGGVEQIRPLNRLRNSSSTSNATCSRCSSLLSLAASGSRYSLNVANTGFISVNNNTSISNSDLKTTNITTPTAVKATITTLLTKGTENDGVVGGSGVGSGSTISIMGGTATTMTTTGTTAVVVSQQLPSNFESITCKLCLTDVKMNAVTTIGQCGCNFCTECMTAYVEFEILQGAYDISCPDAQCPNQGIIALTEIASLASPSLVKKHHRYRLNREIELDKNRTWCPRAGCETVCQVGGDATTIAATGSTSTAAIGISEVAGGSSASASLPIASSSNDDKVNSIIHVLCAVQCPTCREEFCSGCKKPWHPNVSCEENNRRLVAEGQENRVGIPFDNDLIKCCPMCAVPIEKDEGCAQMMCKRCKHVFCWYCLASLDDDFLLRHYDKGPCKNKLGHSRASVVWHRAQVIGIFAGFGILLLVASPLLLLAAPCIICCKCRICSGATKLEDADTEFDEAVALQR